MKTKCEVYVCVWIKPGAPENYRVVTATVAVAAAAAVVVAVIFGRMAKMLVRNFGEMSCEQKVSQSVRWKKSTEITRDREWKINDKKNSSWKSHTNKTELMKWRQRRLRQRLRWWCRRHSLMKIRSRRRRRERRKSTTNKTAYNDFMEQYVCVLYCQHKKWTSLIFFFSGSCVSCCDNSVAGGKSKRHRLWDLLVHTHTHNVTGFHDIIFRNSSIVEKCVFDGGFVCLSVVLLLLLLDFAIHITALICGTVFMWPCLNVCVYLYVCLRNLYTYIRWVHHIMRRARYT